MPRKNFNRRKRREQSLKGSTGSLFAPVKCLSLHSFVINFASPPGGEKVFTEGNEEHEVKPA
jgi:hypothetical protein